MQKNIQTILDEQAGVPNVNEIKQFLKYTDNKTGPGFYDPHSKYLEKKAPGPIFSTHFLKNELEVKPPISTDELEFLVMGHGNLSRKVNQAKDQIKDFLSLNIMKNGKQIKLKGDNALTSRPMNQTMGSVEMQSPTGAITKSVKNSNFQGPNFFIGKKDERPPAKPGDLVANA